MKLSGFISVWSVPVSYWLRKYRTYLKYPSTTSEFLHLQCAPKVISAFKRCYFRNLCRSRNI